MRSGASTDALDVHHVGDAFQLAQRAYFLGETEAHLTLDSLLLRFGGGVDVTDQVHVHW